MTAFLTVDVVDQMGLWSAKSCCSLWIVGTYVLVTALILSQTSLAGEQRDPCEEVAQQRELIACWAKAAERMESELEVLEKKAVTEVGSSTAPAVKQLFDEARHHWDRYRQLHCTGMEKLYGDGSMATMNRSVCRYHLAESRKEELKHSILEWTQR
jgi:uncharacterized protein YecT (DUF1311 family)